MSSWKLEIIVWSLRDRSSASYLLTFHSLGDRDWPVPRLNSGGFLAQLIWQVFFLWPVQCAGSGGGVCIWIGCSCLKPRSLHGSRLVWQRWMAISPRQPSVGAEEHLPSLDEAWDLQLHTGLSRPHHSFNFPFWPLWAVEFWPHGSRDWE